MAGKASTAAPFVRLSPFGFALPARVNAIVGAGIVSADPRVRRRHRFANVASYALAADALVHLLVNSLHDFEALLPVNVYNALAVIAFALMPRMHAFGETAMANALVAMALIGHSYVVFAFGTDSNLHVYFTMAGAVLFFVGIEHWRNFLVLFGCAIAALVNVMVNATPQGFVLPGDAALRASLSLQALGSAMVLNAIVIAFALSALYRTEQRLQREFDRAENLLASILPPAVAKRLKSAGKRRIADRVEQASVLFVDLVGFTAMAGKAGPEEVVDYLHRLFRRFDALCEMHGVDKIKTIGDCYMAAGGLTGRAEGSAARVARLALAMVAEAAEVKFRGAPLAVRAGIHCGPVIAGVIGEKRLAWDIWGDTVNIASRMEGAAQPGTILVSQAFAEACGEAFDFRAMGEAALKNAGAWRTYRLEGAAG